jgi:hypothetical protein
MIIYENKAKKFSFKSCLNSHFCRINAWSPNCALRILGSLDYFLYGLLLIRRKPSFPSVASPDFSIWDAVAIVFKIFLDVVHIWCVTISEFGCELLNWDAVATRATRWRRYCFSLDEKLFFLLYVCYVVCFSVLPSAKWQ